MTRKLYYEDQYISEFSASVVYLTEYKGKKAVVLNETAFFPEGGGQSSDRGKINDIEVTDVQLDGGMIFHIVDSFDGISEGDVVFCSIDWAKRESDMQQHTAEHILSGIIHNCFGLENVGFHLGENEVTCDYPRILGDEELKKVELLANREIRANRVVRAFFPTGEELKMLSYRSKKEINDELRLVEIDGVDLCACCAPHVARTGEIGIVKIIGKEKIRGGTRVFFLAGERAFSDISVKIEQNKKIGVLLSEQEDATFSAVERIKSEKERLSFELIGARAELISERASHIEKKRRQIEFCDLKADDLRRYADLLADKADEFAVALSGEDNDYRFVIISKTGFGLDDFFASVRSKINARGGGRGGIIQGSSAADRETIKNILGGVM